MSELRKPVFPFIALAGIFLGTFFLAALCKDVVNGATEHRFQNYKSYNIEKFSLSMLLPRSTLVGEDNIDNEEILYSSYLLDEKLNFRGNIQVWKINNLSDFLVKSRATSPFHYTSYAQKEIHIDSLNGFQLDWSARFDNRRIVSGREYFLRKNSGSYVLRISFFSNGVISPQLKDTAKKVVTSVKWNND